jgi:hypothetical protein
MNPEGGHLGCICEVVVAAGALHRRYDHIRLRSCVTIRRRVVTNMVIKIVIIIILSSFNDVDPSHIMLVDCCVLFCWECGPVVMYPYFNDMFYRDILWLDVL